MNNIEYKLINFYLYRVHLILIQVTFLIPLFFVIVIRFVILFIITTLIFNYLISKHLTSPMAAPIAQALFMI